MCSPINKVWKDVWFALEVGFVVAFALACDRKDKNDAQASQSKSLRTFSSVDGKFSVLFPGAPREVIRTNEAPFGELVLHTFVVQVDVQTAYAAHYNDFPAAMITTNYQVLFDAGQKSALKNGGKVTFQREIQFQGFPGRVFQFTNGNYTVETKMILAGHRLYQAAAVYASANPHPVDRAMFMDSFRILSE